MKHEHRSSRSGAINLAQSWTGEVVFAARNLSTGKGISWQADKLTPTASCIKLQILIALMSEVEKGHQSLDRMITIKASDLVVGSGVLRYLSPGLTLSLLDVATLMIILSDNSATNIVIDLIGIDTINRAICEIGLKSTRLVNRIDFAKLGNDPMAFAVSTADDFIATLTAIAEEGLLSARCSQKIREIMSRQQYVDLLVRKLPYNVAGKTGFITGFRGDAVIVERLGVTVVMTAFARGDDPSFLTDNAVAVFMGNLGQALFNDLTAV